jgi:RimJ/RimL family protein N-acetyltransferase
VIRVARVTPGDWPVLKALRLAALSDAPYAFATKFSDAAAHPDSYWKETAARRAASPTDCTFFAFAPDGHAVGMAGGYRDPEQSDFVHLVAVWVAPEWRGSGAARAVTEAVCAWAASLPGVATVGAYVAAGNDRALRSYEKAGFVRAPAGTPRPGTHAEECDTLMVRPVAPAP